VFCYFTNNFVVEDIEKLIGGGAGGADPLAGLTGAAAPAAAPGAAPAGGKKAADGDLLADFSKGGLPIPRRRRQRTYMSTTCF
jgi:hypothetical protein